MRRILPLLATLPGLVAMAYADEPAVTYKVVSPRDDGIVATGLNGRGDLIGFEWVEEMARPGVIEQKPFFARGKEITYLPLLKGYTATFPAAVSDEGIVVGRSSKPAPPGKSVPLRNRAFIWDAQGGIRGLGTLKDDTASFATGITRDGRGISGFSVGPGRVRACVWDREGDGWKATALPQTQRLGSTVVAISDNGRHVAAVDGTVPCLWSRTGAGQWVREEIGGPATLVPRAVNDSATVAGFRFLDNGTTRAVVWTRGQGIRSLELPEGYRTSEASAVNNLGAVVGTVDGPRGSKTGPRAFVSEKGRFRFLNEAGPSFTAATAVNDRGQVAGVLEKDDETRPDEASPTRKKDH
jgi:uncharacterized membrane protein